MVPISWLSRLLSWVGRPFDPVRPRAAAFAHPVVLRTGLLLMTLLTSGLPSIAQLRAGQLTPPLEQTPLQVVTAMVPLANMFGYVNELRSFSQGRAQYTMQFSHYDEVPQNVADEVKAKLA